MFHHRAPAGGASAKGNVRVVDRQFVDDRGAFTPLGATFFPLGSHMLNDATVERELTLVGDVEYVRVLGEVGGWSWFDRVVDPRRADYEDVMGRRVDFCASLGKRVHFTIFGGGVVDASEIDAVVEKVVNVLRPRRAAVFCIEIANEDNFPGSDADLRRVAKIISAAMPGVPLMPHSGDNASENLADVAQFLDVCNALSAHLERTDGDKGWRVCRQTWGLNHPCAHAQGEPAGIHLHQGEDVRDPVRLAFMWLVGILNAFTAFVVHTGAGVRLGGQADRNLGRPSSFGDAEMADLPAHVSKCLSLAALLPQGACNWRKTSQRGSEPWSDNFLWADAVWSDGFDHGVSRNYVAYAGSQFVALAFGVLGHVEMKNSRRLQADVHDAYGGGVRHLDVAAGEGFRLEGNEDASAAYVIVGTFS